MFPYSLRQSIQEEISEKRKVLGKFPELCIPEMLTEAHKPMEKINSDDYYAQRHFAWPHAHEQMPWQRRFDPWHNHAYHVQGMVTSVHHAAEWYAATMDFIQATLYSMRSKKGELDKRDRAVLRQSRKALAQVDGFFKVVDKRLSETDSATRSVDVQAVQLEVLSICMAVAHSAMRAAEYLARETGNAQIEKAWLRKQSALMRKIGHVTTAMALKLEAKANSLTAPSKLPNEQ